MKLLLVIVLSAFIVLSNGGVLKREDISDSESNVLSEPNIRHKRTLGIDKKFDREVEIKSKLGSLKVKNSLSYNDGGAITLLPTLLDSVAINHNRILAGYHGIGLTSQIGQQSNAEAAADAEAPIVSQPAPQIPVDELVPQVPVVESTAVNQASGVALASADAQAESTAQLNGASQATSDSEAAVNAPVTDNNPINSAAQAAVGVNESSGATETVANVPIVNESSIDLRSEAAGVSEASGSSQAAVDVSNIHDVPNNSAAQTTVLNTASETNHAFINVPVVFETDVGSGFQPIGVKKVVGGPNVRFLGVGRLSGFGQIRFGDQLAANIPLIHTNQIDNNNEFNIDGQAQSISLASVAAPYETNIQVDAGENKQVIYEIEKEGGFINKKNFLVGGKLQAIKGIGQSAVTGVKNLVDNKVHFISAVGQGVANGVGKVIDAKKTLIKNKIQFVGDVSKGIATGIKNVVIAKKVYAAKKISDGITYLSSLKKVGPPCCPDGPCCPDRVKTA